jgi:hypothetical protein
VELHKNVKQKEKRRLKTEPKSERTEFGFKMKEKAEVLFRLVLTLFVS